MNTLFFLFEARCGNDPHQVEIRGQSLTTLLENYTIRPPYTAELPYSCLADSKHVRDLAAATIEHVVCAIEFFLSCY